MERGLTHRSDAGKRGNRPLLTRLRRSRRSGGHRGRAGRLLGTRHRNIGGPCGGHAVSLQPAIGPCAATRLAPPGLTLAPTKGPARGKQGSGRPPESDSVAFKDAPLPQAARLLQSLPLHRVHYTATAIYFTHLRPPCPLNFLSIICHAASLSRRGLSAYYSLTASWLTQPPPWTLTTSPPSTRATIPPHPPHKTTRARPALHPQPAATHTHSMP